jgi:hypothetical protein
VGTVKSHMKAILDKLEASTRTGAAAVAMRRGIVSAAALAAASPQPHPALSTSHATVDRTPALSEAWSRSR